MAEFMRWLQNPHQDVKVTPIFPKQPIRKAKTVNIIINTVLGFYDYLMRHQDYSIIKTKAKINFNQVAIESGVSKAFLYNNQEIRSRVEGLRKQQEGLNSPQTIKQNMTDASKDSLIAAKNNRIEKLEEENKRLKDELLKLRGMIYDKF
ncbi:DUF6262 family protein [Brevibacillus daliensis]|uniref:DUF6262 family protein n=1 Tax=Brevibacillus daliensis TaxID=2892995 RepID=UPI001E5F0424|nr:DUF6262 family protein [Brevibacillus daliensis]